MKKKFFFAFKFFKSEEKVLRLHTSFPADRMRSGPRAGEEVGEDVGGQPGADVGGRREVGRGQDVGQGAPAEMGKRRGGVGPLQGGSPPPPVKGDHT